MKSYTDIEQSKRLVKILPLESADMCCFQNQNGSINYYGFPFLQGNKDSNPIPCWSLASLLYVLPEGVIENYYVPNLQKENGKYSIAYGNEELLCIADNPVDACYEMIIKLNELKML